MQQILYEAAVQMFFKIGVLKNLQICQKKGSNTGIFTPVGVKLYLKRDSCIGVFLENY